MSVDLDRLQSVQLGESAFHYCRSIEFKRMDACG